MPNKDIFCNSPWYELHIYWDGSLGICCQHSHKLYSEHRTEYNIATMTIKDWFNSEPVRNFRLAMFGQNTHTACDRCGLDEQLGNDSRRFKSNQKSVIFTKTAFDASYSQSPGHRHFEHSRVNLGHTDSQPIDLHIDLGNYCNLACKMCNAQASSTIASQDVKWGIESSRSFLGQDWTKNSEVWHSFKQQLLDIPGLNNIHFMGGETLLAPRLEDLVDFFIQHQRFDMCFSFVTNGTVYRDQLMKKLVKFKRVGIEVSIESLTQANNYIRQGSDLAQVLANIQKFQTWCNGSSVTLALRPAPSALSIGSYAALLSWALTHKLVVKSNIVESPRFLRIATLPTAAKLQYLTTFDSLISQLASTSNQTDYNASDPNNVPAIIKNQVQMCVSALQCDQPPDVDQLSQQLVDHCKKWDQVYGLDARLIYPELAEIWDRHGY